MTTLIYLFCDFLHAVIVLIFDINRRLCCVSSEIDFFVRSGNHVRHRWSGHQIRRIDGRNAPGQVRGGICGWVLPGGLCVTAQFLLAVFSNTGELSKKWVCVFFLDELFISTKVYF